MNAFDVKPLSGGVGAEVIGLDLDRPIDAATARALNEVWLDAGIVLFRGLGTSNERHVRLSRCFGELEVHPVPAIRLEGHPEIIRLANKGRTEQMTYRFEGREVVGRIPWHTDLIYTPATNRGAILRMVEKPAAGGETGWVDTALAYEALPDSTKARIEGVEGRFGFVVDLREMRFGRPADLELVDRGNVDYPTFPEVAQPLVWTHPISGRKSLALSTVHLIDVVGMGREEGDALLTELVDHTLDGRFTYVHDWEEGDMILWDNWRTMHMAFGSPPGQQRVVHRTTMAGEHRTGRLL
ncbi:MAG: TauD/TfdA family dioxygenase [Spirochaetaceae bacterium]|nr:TauD/TfdA family dioxygenase [Myxococcales bacterium]MCB9723269.1 TauD/TfdA family dioxygenase [Spirochaetaceae bacterium]